MKPAKIQIEFVAGPLVLIKETEDEMANFGGGAGMTPFRSQILFETFKTKRKVAFWYGARSLTELYYKKYFHHVAK